MAWPFRGRRESIIRDESFIFIGRTRGISKGLSIVPCMYIQQSTLSLRADLQDQSI